MKKEPRKTITVGEFLEFAEWIRGPGEAGEAIARMTEVAIAYEELYGLVVLPFTVEVWGLDHERCPPPPPDGRAKAMLVCWSVIKAKPISSPFTSDLDPMDLVRLREITRQVAMTIDPGSDPLTDIECDSIIDETAPRSAEKTLRQAVDSKMVH